MFKRTEIELTCKSDELTTGNGRHYFSPFIDWVESITRELRRNSHYHTKVSINSTTYGSSSSEIELTFEADLDIRPGFGYFPESWVEFITDLLQTNPDYDTKVSINSVKFGPIPFNEEAGKYERDKTDYRTSAEWLDKANAEEDERLKTIAAMNKEFFLLDNTAMLDDSIFDELDELS
jgi:hypothetical protein|tara:strand:- start:82 stop:615 length:534 start_codon:yes stop_codon:yes gene_type:complete